MSDAAGIVEDTDQPYLHHESEVHWVVCDAEGPHPAGDHAMLGDIYGEDDGQFRAVRSGAYEYVGSLAEGAEFIRSAPRPNPA